MEQIGRGSWAGAAEFSASSIVHIAIGSPRIPFMPRKSTIVAALLLAAGATPAMAAAKCTAYAVRLCDGCSVTSQWQVALAPTGPAAAHAFCRMTWRNLGGHIHFTVVQPPHAGTVRTHDYSVLYRGERQGKDTMTLHVTWLGRSNDVLSGDITYDITVFADQ